MSYRPYDHLERIDHDEVEGLETGRVFVFPKLDGTNAVVWFDQDQQRVCTGSRRREINIEQDNHGFAAWVNSDDAKAIALRDYCRDNPTHVVYGEWLVPHSLKTYRPDAWRRFWIFDVFDRATSRYVDFHAYFVCMTSVLDVVLPMCVITNPGRDQLQAQVEMNTFLVLDGAGVGEGIVLKNYEWTNRFGRQPWAKIVRNEFKEQNAIAFGITEKQGAAQVEHEIVQKHVTPALVGKTRAKIIADIANSVGLDLVDPNVQQHIEATYRGRVIPQLIGRVFHDLVVEELWPALKEHKNPTIDFKLLARHCTLQTKRLAADLFGIVELQPTGGGS